MPIEFEVKINRVHGSLRMTVPKEVATIVLVGLTDSTMSVRKKV